MKNLFKAATHLADIAGELKRLRELAEWLVINHSAFGEIGLPPTEAEMKAAQEEKYELLPEEDEEQAAIEAAIRILKARGKGKFSEIEDEPGKDWTLD